MPTEHAKIQHEAGARRLAQSLALVGGMLFGDPNSAVAAPTTTGNALATGDALPTDSALPTSVLPSSVEPTTEAHDADSETAESGGLPRVVVYGAVAGLFLLVAAGLGAHRKH